MIKLLLQLCSRLPLSANQTLGTMVGTVAAWLPTESRTITRANIRLCYPSLSVGERKRMVRQSLIETAKTACELGLAWEAPVNKALAAVVCVRGHEMVSAALALKKGVIIVAPHLGNWEICGTYLTTLGPTTYLYKPQKHPVFEELILAARSRSGAVLGPTNRKGVAMLIKALERGEIVGVLPDQEPKMDGGVFAPFFGADALTMTLVSKLAARTGAIAITAFAKRLPAGAGFEIVLNRTRSGVASTDATEAATALNLSVEDCVRQTPTQYQWEYKRFNRLPDGSKNPIYR